MKLHLGCGKRNFGTDWVHIDGGDFPHLQSNDITNLPFDDESVDLIYASHVIEYFNRNEIISLLKEWRRVLKNNGVLRLAVPDFNSMVNLYLNGYPIETFLGPLYGKMDMSDTTIYHKTTYDYNLYVLPIINKDPNRFVLLCKGHHSLVEKLKRFKLDKLERLFKVVKESK